MKILIAQIDSVVGDFEGNRRRMQAVLEKASSDQLVIFPECSLTGYPQLDLLESMAFSKHLAEESEVLIREAKDKSFIFGSVERNSEKGRPFRNIAVFVENSKIIGKYFKRLLPSYDVFDEDRFFEAGREALLVEWRGKKFGITICEDIWNHDAGPLLQNRYFQNPVEDSKGADILINISASPFEYQKVEAKREMLSRISKTYKLPLIYVNSVGANDGLIFDGRSTIWNENGELCLECEAFSEAICEFSMDQLDKNQAPKVFEPIPNIYDALVLGIRDYCRKLGFSSVVVGMSGGIDSAVVTCLAADALGAENVVGVMMPSRYTSKESNEDAYTQAVMMQNPLHIFSIEEIYQASLRTMELAFRGTQPDISEENLQSRARGMILMALTNKFNLLALATGNKSELAVGYCTLYGDMNGALAPLSDLYKTQVYELGREANRRRQRIPERVFIKAPSAELRANQTDQDSLPSYEILDGILKLLIEKFQTEEEIIAQGFDSETVKKVIRLYSKSEFKRYQMPLGLKVSAKAFGIGRRIPLVQKFF